MKYYEYSNTVSLHNQQAININPTKSKNESNQLPPPAQLQIKALRFKEKLKHRGNKHLVKLWNIKTKKELPGVFELKEAVRRVEESRTCPPMVDTKPKDCFWRHENCWNARAIERNYQLSLNLGQGGAE